MMLKILLIFEENPNFMPAYLRDFLKRSKNTYKIVGLTPSYTEKAYPDRARKGETFFSYARKNPFRFGLKAFFYYGIKMVYYYVCNSLCSVLRFNSPYTVEGVARKYGIPIIETIRINEKAYLNKLKKMNIDVIISTNGQIFEKELLSLPNYGCLNIHASIMPSYAGCYPALYCLLNNEKQYGISCHTMEKGIDKGTVVAQRRFPIKSSDTVTSLYKRAYELAAEVLEEGINNFMKKENYPDTHDIEPSYYGFPTEKELKKFFASGKKFL